MASNATCPLRLAVRRGLAEFPASAIGVVAVSGGPDSVALLRALALETKSPLAVAHLNHLLRGEESDGDEAFVRELYSQLEAKGASLCGLCCDRIDVRGEAAGDNLEAVARRVRYDWLANVARKTNAVWVATGHTADDQAETVLHRLVRGTGLRGLAGISAKRELAAGIALIRPLLSVRRREVLTFLAELGQSYRQDSTNLDRNYTRTRLRHELLPELEQQYNPGVADVLSSLAEQSRLVQAFLDEHAAKLLGSVELPRAGEIVVLDARTLQTTTPVLVTEALRLIWVRENWPLGEMGHSDWQRIVKVISGEAAAVDLPGGVEARRVGHVIQLRPKLR